MTPERIAVKIATAAHLVELAPNTIRNAIDAGELPAKKVGRTIRIRVADLDQWIRSREDARAVS